MHWDRNRATCTSLSLSLSLFSRRFDRYHLHGRVRKSAETTNTGKRNKNFNLRHVRGEHARARRKIPGLGQIPQNSYPGLQHVDFRRVEPRVLSSEIRQLFRRVPFSATPSHLAVFVKFTLSFRQRSLAPGVKGRRKEETRCLADEFHEFEL